MFFYLLMSKLNVGHAWAMFTHAMSGCVSIGDGSFVRRPSAGLRRSLGTTIFELTVKQPDELVKSVSG